MKLLIHLLITIGLFIYIPEWGSSDDCPIEQQHTVAQPAKKHTKKRVVIPAPSSLPKRPAQVYERKPIAKPKTIKPIIHSPSSHKGIHVLTGIK